MTPGRIASIKERHAWRTRPGVHTRCVPQEVEEDIADLLAEVERLRKLLRQYEEVTMTPERIAEIRALLDNPTVTRCINAFAHHTCGTMNPAKRVRNWIAAAPEALRELIVTVTRIEEECFDQGSYERPRGLSEIIGAIASFRERGEKAEAECERMRPIFDLVMSWHDDAGGCLLCCVDRNDKHEADCPVAKAQR